jgi:hypothetical protein
MQGGARSIFTNRRLPLKRPDNRHAMDEPLKIHILVGSVREGRVSLPVAQWVDAGARAREDFDTEIIDLAEWALKKARPNRWQHSSCVESGAQMILSQGLAVSILCRRKVLSIESLARKHELNLTRPCALWDRPHDSRSQIWSTVSDDNRHLAERHIHRGPQGDVAVGSGAANEGNNRSVDVDRCRCL